MARTLFQMHQGYKAFGSKILFEQASFSINEGEHCGVIGPNGAGKTTLFKVLVGEQELDSGKLVFSKNLKLGYLTQHEDFSPGQIVESYFHDSVMPLWDVKSLGRGLGLSEELFSKEILSFSGGYRMRVKLLKLLSQEPDLLLLDEPTNYLDLETLLVLERFLQDYRGSFLLISHDREFLRRTTDHTLEVEGGDITKYPGMIDDYFEQKELLASQLQARALSLEQKRNEVLAFVNRFGAKATKAAQAQSRLKMLSKMESIELKPLPVKARIRIPEPIRTGRIVLSLEKAHLGYGKNEVLKKVDLNIMAGDHCAIIGLNGAGKSTLLKTLASELPVIQGEFKKGYQVEVGFYAQHVSEGLDLEDTVFESLSQAAHPTLYPQDVLDCAGSLLFSGESVKKKIALLSGGERSRVALGRILLSRAPCLILDEPTNHLDFQTVEALTVALKKFPGAVIVVSHDRSFIQRIGTKILEVKNGGVHVYPGSYEDYVWSVQQQQQMQESATEKSDEKSKEKKGKVETIEVPVAGTTQRAQKKELDKKIRAMERDIQKLEEEIKKAQAEIQTLNELFVSDATAVTHEKMDQFGKEQIKLEKLEKKWLELMEEKEAILSE